MSAWDRLPEETPREWGAFQAYLSLGAGRSHEAVAEATGLAPRTIRAYARRRDWAARVTERDSSIVKAGFEHLAREARDIIAEHLKIAKGMRTLGIAVVSLFLRAVKEDPARASEIKIRDAVLLLSEGMRLERLALEDLRTYQLTAEKPPDFSRFTPQELEQLSAMVRKSQGEQ